MTITKLRKIIKYFSVFVILVLIASVWFYSSVENYHFGSLCLTDKGGPYYKCFEKYLIIGERAILASLLVLLLTIIALIATEPRIRKTWAMFSYWFIPIAVVLTLLSPGDCGSDILSKALCWNKGVSLVFFFIAYFSISLLILIIKSIKLRREKSG
ncbi:MAG: hypothetical protein WC659_06480 [Patescibacteria group bacterium]